MSYPVEQVINITTRITPAGLNTANFASAMVFAPNNELPSGFPENTFRTYFSVASVAEDFATDTETYKAAAKWLGSTPAVSRVQIWASAAPVAATAGKLVGGVLSSDDQTIDKFTAITNGTLNLVIDGTPRNLTDINLSSAATLSDVANTLQTALSTHATATWNSGTAQFTITSTTTGSTSSVVLGSTPGTVAPLIKANTGTSTAGTSASGPVQALTAAFDVTWFYWIFFTATVLADKDEVLAIAQWAEDNNVMFVNSQTATAATAIRDPSNTTDIASQLNTLGYRHVFTPTHATDAYSGNALAKHFAVVNYSADNSTITGEFKKSPGVAAEDLSDTAYATMQAKKTPFYTQLDLQGSTDAGRWINTWTHSTYGEFIDDIVNLDAFVNALRVGLYNALANQTTKLAQTPVGQAVLIGAAKRVCEQYIRNNYLGPRNYIDPDTGLEAYTNGYEILTQPEDILDLSDADRSARKSAPIRIRVFRAGAIHMVDVSVDVF